MTMFSRALTVVCVSALLVGCTASRPPSYNLPSAGQIVAGDSYTVGRNENVYAIAQKNGVRLRDIIALNELKPPFALRPGQVITLPAKDQLAAPTPTAAPLEPIDKGYMGPASNGSGGAAGITTVQAEELPPISGTSVSSAPLTPPSFSRSPTPSSDLSSSPTPKTNWTGLPQPEADTGPSPVQDTAPAALPPMSAAQDGATGAALSTQPQQTATQSPAETLNASSGEPSPASASDNIPTFGWPVRGTIISGFGPKGQGLDNDGINIAAPKGSPVKAAGGGMVAYAGNEMKGFGNLVLIRHEGGWVTAYAHLDRLVVSKDTVVAKGDMIGTVGTTGGVSSPQLHFETRQDGKPVDPELMMK